MAANRSADIDTRLANIEIRVNDIAGTFLLCCISELAAESGVCYGRYPQEICRP